MRPGDDLHARVDRYGLGPGVYPKALAPKPPAHAHCRCMLSPRVDIRPETKWRENPAAHRVWLREQGISEGAKVMGSRAKLAVALTQAPIDEVINIHRPRPYWVGRVGKIGDMDATARTMLDGLTTLAGKGGPDLLETVFDNPRSYARHVSKRMAAGDIDEVADYRARTFAVLASASRMTIAESADLAMRPTGKMQVTDGAWIVLLGERGNVVTSYPVDSAKMTFEARHASMGDRVYEQEISDDYRKALARIFGAG